jgi:hypothetical protein
MRTHDFLSKGCGSFPTGPASRPWLRPLLQERDDEWQVAERRYFSIGSINKIDAELEGATSGPLGHRLEPRVAVVIQLLTGRDPHSLQLLSSSA